MVNIHLDMTNKTSRNLFVMLKAEKMHSSSVLPGPAGSWAAGLGKRDRAEGGREGGKYIFILPRLGEVG